MKNFHVLTLSIVCLVPGAATEANTLANLFSGLVNNVPIEVTEYKRLTINNVMTLENTVEFEPSPPARSYFGEETIVLEQGERLIIDSLTTATDSDISNIWAEVEAVAGEGFLPVYYDDARDVILGPATCRLRTYFFFRGDATSAQVTYIANFEIVSSIDPSELPPLDDLFQTDQFGRLVIPESTTGPVSIILESSNDMLDWVNTNPGTYGAGEVRRFFRLRATLGDG